MGTLLRLIKWFWRAWPILILIFLICEYLLSLNWFSQNAGFINKTASLVAQPVGGLLILYSINSNIGVIKQKSLLSILTSYFKEFPLIKKSVVIEARGAAMAMTGVKAKITASRNPVRCDCWLCCLTRASRGTLHQNKTRTKRHSFCLILFFGKCRYHKRPQILLQHLQGYLSAAEIISRP